MGKIFSFRDTSSEIEELEKKRMEDLREAVKYSQKEGVRKPTVVIQFSWELIALILLILAIIFFGSQLISVLLFLFLGFVFTSAAKQFFCGLCQKRSPKVGGTDYISDCIDSCPSTCFRCHGSVDRASIRIN
jgi:hypothetical protein